MAKQKKPKPSGYIDITKQYGIPQFTEEYINKAMELNKQYPGSKFVCTANGCADIASQAATAMGHNFGKANAWEYGNRSDVLFTNPNYAKELENPTGPLHDPTSYNVPNQFLGMENVLVGLNRKNNLLDVQGNKVGNIPNAQQVGAAKTRAEANDSLDYANQNLYKGSRGYEHVGYMMGNNTLLHGTGASKDHPAFFVLDDINDGIDLSGYGKYEPVEAIAEPTTMQTFTNKVRSLGTRTGEMIFGEPGSKQASSNIIKKENGGWLDKYEPGGTVAKTDATRVAAPLLKLTKAQLEKNKSINKQVMVNTEKANAKILAERKKGIAESSEADIINPNDKRFAIGDKFRMFPNDIGGVGEMFDDFINPAVFVGNTASGLGNAMIDRDPAALAIETGMALGTGALGFDPLGSTMKAIPNTYKIPKPSVDFSKYLTQEEAIAARAKRLISQKDKPGWNEQFTPDLETRLKNAVKNHDPASDYPGEKLGSNILGRTATLVSKDANLSGVPLTEANKARVAAHETGHYYSNSVAEGEEWLKPFNLNKLESYKTKTYLRGKGRSNNYANEIRERAAQLKDYIAQKNEIPLNQDFKITQTQLNDAIKNYVKDTGLDNTMSKMLGTLKDKKGLLKTMNKYALGAAPVGIVAGALQQKKEDGGWLEKYNDGGPVQPNYNDYSVSAGPGFEGDGYSNVGRNYSPAWGGQFEDGGNLSFIKDPKLRNMLEGYQSGLMQPGDYRLPEGRMAGNIDPSTEVSISIGGEDGEPSYLIPSFKYGSPLQDPTQEFNMTGQYLGGPFKTWQDAEAYGELRHQYIDKGYKELPSPIATSNMAMGGSLPGATGFMYARVGAPSNGKYAKKTMASAENGTEMRYYQEGFDFNPKSISEDGSKNSKLTNQEMIKKLGLKPVQTVNPIEQENLYAPKANPITGDGTLKDLYNFEKDMFKRGLEVVANPISALSALNRHGRLPRNFSKGEFSPFDLATSWFNPAARIESGINTYDSAKNVLSGKGGFGDYADLVLNASSLKNVGKAAGKEIKKIKKTINFNKQQKLLPNRDAADWMKNMYSDPIIQQRILNNTPDEFTKGYTDISYNNETGEVISNIIPDVYGKAKRTFWNDPVTNPIGNKNYNDLYKEKGFKDWLDLYPRSLGVSYGKPDEIYAKSSLFNKAERESTRVHEATHAMEYNGMGFFKEEDDKLLKPFNLTGEQQWNLPSDKGYGKKYYTKPTEIHARMNESRYKLGHTPGQEYTMGDFNKSLGMDNLGGMGNYIEDPKAFIELMNTFYQAAPVLGAGALGAAAIANQPEMEQGGQLTKLDQLTNFTNYNTKQPGGWLDKYQ